MTSPAPLHGSMISRRVAALLRSLRRGSADLDGKPEGLAFTAQGRAIVHAQAAPNLVLLEPAIAQA